MERRFATELRATSEEGGKFIQGYAATFGHESTDDGLGFREIVMPGAFARSLREGADVRALFNHDPNKILGRVKNGTLQLREDSRGLFYRVALDPNNTDHMNMHAAIARGDVDECSFGFIAKSQEWSDVRGADGNLYAQRKLHDVDLMDVSAVVYPAYGNTSVVARSARIQFMFPEGDAEIRSAIKVLEEKRGGPKPADADDVNKSGVLPVEVCDAWVKAYNDAFEEAVESKKSNKEANVIAIGCANKAISEMVAKSPADAIDGSGGKDENDIPGEQVDDDDDEQEDADEAERTKRAEMESRNEHIGETYTADGDCTDPTCWCQNRMIDPLDVWADEDFEDENDDDTYRAVKRAERKAAAETESRAGKKARTKTVGGKHLPASAFAYVGDPEKTETWKLPIHDADHVRNALARFNQTQGIPASAKAKAYGKIKAAAKKFGIHVSEENSSDVNAETATMQLRVRVLQTDLKYGL